MDPASGIIEWGLIGAVPLTGLTKQAQHEFTSDEILRLLAFNEEKYDAPPA